VTSPPCPPRDEFALPFADGKVLLLGRISRVMGVLNVTPDSFSGGGSMPDLPTALDAAARMADEGADLIDVGGESTRPGSSPVPVEEETRRILSVIEGLKRRIALPVSVDTVKAAVARRALEAGADLVNDVSSFADPGMLPLLAKARAPVVLMHMRGTPRTMQEDTHYADLMGDVAAFLKKAVHRAEAAGIPDARILVDPGIGFGKSASGSLEILRRLPVLRSVGRPILIGASRKSFIGAVLDLPVTERLEGSLAAAAVALWQGAHVVRAHDVAATVRVARMIDALRAW